MYTSTLELGVSFYYLGDNTSWDFGLYITTWSPVLVYMLARCSGSINWKPGTRYFVLILLGARDLVTETKRTALWFWGVFFLVKDKTN